MDEAESLSHSKWECKYHVVFIPKCRRKTLYEPVTPPFGRSVPQVSRPEGEFGAGRPSDGRPCPHVDPIPPKYAVSQVVGFIKGKRAIHLARVYGERRRNFVGMNFWARGYFGSTVGRDETVIRAYIRHQEQEDQDSISSNLGTDRPPTGGPERRGRVSAPA